MKRSLVLMAVIVTVLAGRVDATLVAADSFLQGPAAGRPLGQYATGDIRTSGTTLLGFTTGTGTNQYAGTTSNFQIEATVGAFQNSPAVEYDTQITTGGTQRQISWGGAADAPTSVRNVTREFNTTALTTNAASGEWWMSIMLNRNSWVATQNTAVVGGFANASDSNNGVAFGYSDATVDGVPDLVMRSNYITITPLVTNVSANTLQFVIAKLNINTTGLDTITVWVNPSDVSSEAALGLPITTIATHEVSNNLNNPFTRSRFVSLGITGPAKFDELRLATSLGSLVAIPEASSFLAGAVVSVLVAVGYRFRRR